MSNGRLRGTPTSLCAWSLLGSLRVGEPTPAATLDVGALIDQPNRRVPAQRL